MRLLGLGFQRLTARRPVGAMSASWILIFFFGAEWGGANAMETAG